MRIGIWICISVLLSMNVFAISQFGEGTGYGTEARDNVLQGFLLRFNETVIDSVNITFVPQVNNNGLSAKLIQNGTDLEISSSIISNHTANFTVGLQYRIKNLTVLVLWGINSSYTGVFGGSHNIPETSDGVTQATIFQNTNKDTLANTTASAYLGASTGASLSKGLYFVNTGWRYTDNIAPTIDGTINNTSPKINQIVNVSFNVIDETALSYCMFIDNQSLPNGAKNYFNKSVSGTSDSCSQNYTIRLTRGNSINFSVVVNDSSNNIRTNTTILTVSNTPPNSTEIVNSSGNFTTNITLNWTASSDVDLDIVYYLVFYNQSNTFIMITNTTNLNVTTNLTSGNYSLIVNVSDNTETIAGTYFHFSISSTSQQSQSATVTPLAQNSGGAGSGGVLNRCDPLAQAYVTYYFYDNGGCTRGCPQGYSCNKGVLQCELDGNTTTIITTFNAPEFDAPIFKIWQKIKTYIGGFFDNSPTLFEAKPLSISTPSSESGTSTTITLPEDAPPIDVAKAKLVANPIMALVIVGLIAMALVLFQVGVLLIVPPYLYVLIAYWLIVAIVWKFNVFGG